MNSCQVFNSLISDKLVLHMWTHSDVKNFLCSECGKKFKQPAQLRNHQVSVHKTDGDEVLHILDNVRNSALNINTK